MKGLNNMVIRATLDAFCSERDIYGNCYWALRYTDHKTGRSVQGMVSGGESNIYGVLRESDRARKLNDWDRSIRFTCQPVKKREFNRMTKGWAYAGCSPDQLWTYIKTQLKNGGKVSK